MKSILKYRLYFGLRARSWWRFCRELPLVVCLLFLLCGILGGYMLYINAFPNDFRYYIGGFLLFVFLGHTICRMKKAEAVLLHTLDISPLPVYVFKLTFLTVPFFLLDGALGGIVICIGIPFIIFLSKSKRSVPGVLKPISIGKPFGAAYQWLSAARSRFPIVVAVLFILFVIALVIKNMNMACAMMVGFICVPGFLTYLSAPDAKAFMRVYKSPRYLLLCKLKETVVFSLLPCCLCVGLSLTAFTASQIVLFLLIGGGCLLVNVLWVSTVYAFYPHIITSIVLSFLVIFFGSMLIGIYPWIALPFILIALLLLFFSAEWNLRKIDSPF